MSGFDMALMSAYREQGFPVRVAKLVHRFALLDRHDEGLGRSYQNPENNSAVYAAINGLRALTDNLDNK